MPNIMRFAFGGLHISGMSSCIPLKENLLAKLLEPSQTNEFEIRCAHQDNTTCPVLLTSDGEFVGEVVGTFLVGDDCKFGKG